MIVATAAEMRRAEEIAFAEFGISQKMLMENAGRGAFQILKNRFPDLSRKKIVVIAGKGNNGGDGRVLARLLRDVAREVSVLEIDSFPGEQALLGADILVDAIFGTGLSREVTGKEKGIIESINRAGKYVISLDIPSGLSADTGHPLGVAVRASLTVVMGLPKLGLILPDAVSFVGDLEVVAIGIPQEIIRRLNLKIHWVTEKEIKPLFGPRNPVTHKGDYGHLLLVGGSGTKPGAILLAGRAALRTGAGLVTVALPDRAFKKIPNKGFLELMYEPLPSTSTGTFSRKGWNRLEKLLQGKDGVAVGPGMGAGADSRQIVRRLLEKGKGPVVVDADGLNALGRSAFKIGGGCTVVMTPHPGEMARLTGKTVSRIQSDRMTVARNFAIEKKVHLVLKGFRTVIARPDGKIFVNSTGNPGMATAGMGDVLTGIIGSLIAQGFSPADATVAGVFLHGRSGDRVSSRLGDRGFLATDVIEEIPLTIHEILL